MVASVIASTFLNPFTKLLSYILLLSLSPPPPLPLSMFYCLQLSAFHIARVIGYRRLLLAALAFAVHV